MTAEDLSLLTDLEIMRKIGCLEASEWESELERRQQRQQAKVYRAELQKRKIKRAGDQRIKCRCCRRYMRFGLATEKTPAKRREPPHASRCTDCPPNHYACGCPESHSDWEERLRVKQEHEPHCPGRTA